MGTRKIGYGTVKGMPHRIKKQRAEAFEGVMHNHKFYKNNATMELMYFFDTDGQVRAAMDVELEELYMVPTPSSTTHEVFSAICNKENVPYLDQSDAFQIAVPMSFYVEKAKQIGTAEHYERSLKLEKLFWEKWEEAKERMLKNYKRPGTVTH